MTSMIQELRAAARKRARYNRTVREISSLPTDVALDLDIYPKDAHRIAHEAVYGR